LAAVILVGDNQYYGFNRNVGNAASANFKSLGYISLQLRIEIDYDEILANYRGAPDQVPMKNWIDASIATYLNQYENVGAIIDVNPEDIDFMRRLIEAITG
jgi:regulation of enolase protein 1 (concanavalin A-like superfamily)